MKKNNSTIIAFVSLFALCLTVVLSSKPATVFASKDVSASINNEQFEETVDVMENANENTVVENNNENIQVDNSATAENCNPVEDTSSIEENVNENTSTIEESAASNESENNEDLQQEEDESYVTDEELAMVKLVFLYEQIVEGIEKGEDVSTLVAEYEFLSAQIEELYYNN